MRDLAGPALVEGQADSPVDFIPVGFGPPAMIRAYATNGQFRVFLPQGKYTVQCQGEGYATTFLPASTHHLDLRPGRAFDFEISEIGSKGREVRISLKARGEGIHRFSIRTDNLALQDTEKELTLKRGGGARLEWSGRILSFESPWVAVVMADDSPTNRKELMGAAWKEH